MRPFLLALSLALAGCAPVLSPVRIEAPEGYAISFPASPETASGRDGPVEFRIDAARTWDSARFELAWFRFPQALDAGERAQLMERVERGIMAGGARVVSRALPPGNKDRVDLILDLDGDRRGYYRILYPTAKTMVQVSAVGPAGSNWEQTVARFMGSLVLRDTAPIKEDPVSASLGEPVLDTY